MLIFLRCLRSGFLTGVLVLMAAPVIVLIAQRGARAADAQSATLHPATHTTGQLAVVFPLMAPRLSSEFGKREHPITRYVKHHNGVDLAAPENSHVRVVSPGVVIFADSYAGYGKLVTVQHKNGYASLYGHLSEIRVNPGQRVAAGEVVGRVGSTGLATGPHLHFEWRRAGTPVDPLDVFPSLAKRAEG